jgi:hypothetical protein
MFVVFNLLHCSCQDVSLDPLEIQQHSWCDWVVYVAECDHSRNFGLAGFRLVRRRPIHPQRPVGYPKMRVVPHLRKIFEHAVSSNSRLRQSSSRIMISSVDRCFVAQFDS